MTFLSKSFYLLMMSTAVICYGNDPIPNSEMAENSFFVAEAAEPQWHFASGSCYPQAAEVNGVQTNGNAQDDCIISGLSSGCQYQIPWVGTYNTKGPNVPTYYSVKYCPNDHSWRASYAIYFRHDQSHESDWEYVIVVWKQRSDSMWIRDSIIFEEDPHTPHYAWNDIQTIYDTNDMFNENQVGLNHPKVYISKFNHATNPGKAGDNKNNCAVSNQFRWNDYYLYVQGGSNLVPYYVTDPNWDWGKAHSCPQGLFGQGKYASEDACNK